MAKRKKQKTTRDTSFNFTEKDSTITTLSSYTATKTNKNIRLLGAEDGMSVKGEKIMTHAAANKTMEDLEYKGVVVKVNAMVKNPNYRISSDGNYRIYGAPFKSVLNNRQHYNNCGVESTLNTLAMAGKINMKENLSDQKSVEKNFLKNVWNMGLVGDSGVIGKLDEPDGGTEPDDYKDILRLYDIDSEAYYVSRKCDGTQFDDINKLAYDISQGYGAVIGVCSDYLWQEQESETGKEMVDHAITIVGVVYNEDTPPAQTDEYGNITGYNRPLGFYIHDSGAWMTRYISLDEFKYVTLFQEHGMTYADYENYIDYDEELTEGKFDELYPPESYNENLRDFDSELRKYVGKKPEGIFVTITSEPIKDEMFNLNATGDKQNNTIWGNSGDNIIKGMDGKDTLYGNAGDDDIRGGKGNDIIIGNKLYQGDLEEFKEYLSDDAKSRLNGVENTTSYKYYEGMNKLHGDAGSDIIFGGDDIDLIYGGDGNDYIWAGGGRNAVYGGKGKDVILGGWDNDRILGGAGDDTIYGFGDDDTIHGGDGNDTIYGGSGNDKIETGKGTDTIFFEGTEHGIDEVTSEGGATTFKFVDEVYEYDTIEGAKISDMYFSLERDEDSKKVMNLGMTYTADMDNATDGIAFNKFFNSKTNKAKSLTLTDKTSTYKVSASNKNTAKVIASANNIFFTTYDQGTTITTSTNDDIVTMVETEDPNNRYSDSELVFDSITYTGGNDRYVSQERNTYYYVENFGKDTKLSIYDNIEALEKTRSDEQGMPVIDPDTEKPFTDEVVSTDDRLYVNTTLSNLSFFFDVSKSGGLTYPLNTLYVLDKDNLNSDIYIDIAGGESVTGCGMISIDSFFGNGEIESLYTKGNGTDYTKFQGFDTYIQNAASAVATWLSEAHDEIYYSSAFEAIASDTIKSGDFDNLIACYKLNPPV